MSYFDSIDGIIFDLDGTLLDSMWVWSEVDKVYLGRRGIAVPDDYMRAINHMTAREVADYSIERFDLADSPEELIDEWDRLARHMYMQDVYLKANALEFLQKIHAKGIKCAVATSTLSGLAAPVLERNGVLQYFDSITYTSEVDRGKGFPDVYLRSAAKSALSPERTLVLEDILQGVRGAKAGGFKVFGIYDSTSLADKAEIMRIADGYIYGFDELLKMW